MIELTISLQITGGLFPLLIKNKHCPLSKKLAQQEENTARTSDVLVFLKRVFLMRSLQKWVFLPAVCNGTVHPSPSVRYCIFLHVQTGATSTLTTQSYPLPVHSIPWVHRCAQKARTACSGGGIRRFVRGKGKYLFSYHCAGPLMAYWSPWAYIAILLYSCIGSRKALEGGNGDRIQHM